MGKANLSQVFLILMMHLASFHLLFSFIIQCHWNMKVSNPLKKIPISDFRLSPIELLSGDEFEILVSIRSNGVSYLHHSPVFKVAEASNVNIVLDASSRYSPLPFIKL